MTRPRRRRPQQERRFIDEIEIGGVTLRRITLPNGKRAFEEEGVRALLCFTMISPDPSQWHAFEEFTRPEARH